MHWNKWDVNALGKSRMYLVKGHVEMHRNKREGMALCKSMRHWVKVQVEML